MSDFPPIPYQVEGETEFHRAMRYWNQVCKDAKRIEELEQQVVQGWDVDRISDLLKVCDMQDERIEALEQRHTFNEKVIVALQDRNKALEQELAARIDNYDYWRQYAEELELRDREWQAMTGAPVPPPLPPEASRLAELEAENAVLLKTFSHYHRASGTPGDDACAECGLDLRKSIHLRAALEDKDE